MFKMTVAVLVVCIACCGAALADQKTVVLASLDWPPYSSPALAGDGASAEVVRAALKEVGYTLEIRYFPWKRAVHEALVSPEFDGFFPEYYGVERSRLFHFSDAIGTSPLGLAERQSPPTRWSVVQDLQGLRIGTVQGYVNSPEFDHLVEQGELAVDASVSDVINLRKVAKGRLDAAVVDGNVLRYFLNADPLLRQEGQGIALNPKLLVVHDLLVAFRKNPRGEELVKALNQGLRRIDAHAMQRQYIEFLTRQ